LNLEYQINKRSGCPKLPVIMAFVRVIGNGRARPRLRCSSGVWPLAYGFLLCLLLLLPGVAQGQQSKFKRLILKDGSYELISQYQIRGDRVRYFSSERKAWEELPYSLVDWTATGIYAGESSQLASEHKNEALEEAAAERKDEEAKNPLVATGIRLPSPDGVYLLDSYQGQSELNLLVQNGADLNKNMGKNILRGVVNPIAGPRQTVELKGLHARIRSHVSSPTVYFPIDPDDPSMEYTGTTAKNHLRIFRCSDKKGNRVVAVTNTALYGKTKQTVDTMSIKVEPLSDYWVRIVPAVPLKTGEYALVELDGKGRMNQFVWDFGVDPAAPPNPAAVRASPDRSEPVLIQKPRKSPTAK
jgi:hypothetical protein